MFAFARVHMRPISPIRHDRDGTKEKRVHEGGGVREDGGGAAGYFLAAAKMPR